MPDSLAARAEAMKEKRDQLRAYERMLKAENRRIESSVEKVRLAFSSGMLGEVCISDQSRKSVINFLSKLPEAEVIEAATLAVSKKRTPQETFRYFCGICWSKIRGGW